MKINNKIKTQIKVKPKNNARVMKTKNGKKKGKKNKKSADQKLGVKLEKLSQKGIEVEKIVKAFGNETIRNIVQGFSPEHIEKKKSKKGKDSNDKPKQSSRIVQPDDPTSRIKRSLAMECVKSLLDYKKDLIKDKELFNGPEQIHLQLSLVKKATTPRRSVNYWIPHEFMNATDICAIVKDEGMKVPVEVIADKYKTLFKDAGINNVKSIFTMRQINTEYKRFEMIRKLQSAFDVFIADKTLYSQIMSKFRKLHKSKRVFFLEFNNELKVKFDKSLKSTTMVFSSTADMYNCIIGNTSMSYSEITDNLLAVITAITTKDTFPGGWRNVRQVTLRKNRSPAFPLYYSKLMPGKVKPPIMKERLPKEAVAVEGELNTIMGSVKVEPDGTVTKIGKSDNTINSDDDEEEENESSEQIKKKTQKSVKNPSSISIKIEQDDSDNEGDDSSDEGDIGSKAEADYLKYLNGDLSKRGKSKVNPKKDVGDILPENKVSSKKAPQSNKKKPQKSVKSPPSINKIKQEDADNEGGDSSKAETDYSNRLNGHSSKTLKFEMKSEDKDSEDESDVEERKSKAGNKKSPVVFTPKSNKRKQSFGNNTSPSKKTKPNQTKKGTANTNEKGKGKFDTRLGETWAISKEKQQTGQKHFNNQNGGKHNKKGGKNKKMNKHQRKASLKMKKAKQSKSH